MIIECPSCTSRYRIREDKLPEAGGNIKCPNCAHIFFVPRVASASVSGAAPVAHETASGPPGPAESAAATVAAPRASRRWKLKNPVGLVYDFQDTEQLRAWLKSRDSFQGFQVSDDAGASWKPVEGFDELADITPTGKPSISPQAAIPLHRSGEQRASSGAAPETFPATADQMRDAAQARLREARKARKPTESGIVTKQQQPKAFQAIKQPEDAEAKKASMIMAVAAVFLVPIALGIALHAAGVIDLADYGLLPGGLRPPEYVAPTYRPNEVAERDDGPELTVEQGVNMLMRQAAAAQSRGELPLAAQALEQATQLDPDDLELWCLLEPMYAELGRTADVASAHESCERARAIERGEVPAEGSAEPAPAEGSAAEAPTTP